MRVQISTTMRLPSKVSELNEQLRSIPDTASVSVRVTKGEPPWAGRDTAELIFDWSEIR